MSTVYALATPPGRAGVAVVRVSGKNARACVEKIAGSLPQNGRVLRSLYDLSGEPLDSALVLTFEEGRSFTGEEVVELHTHGAPVVVRAVLRALGEIEGVTPAEPGEFTRRAFENGRLDLSQVEGLADLLNAETERQRKQALATLSGSITEQVEAWRSDLIRAMALIEATIDFADEEVPVDVRPDVEVILRRLQSEFSSALSSMDAAEQVRDGFVIAIVGAPNVGKSTLLNRLAGRDAAITSDIAGTTRDIIEVKMEIRGLSVSVLDTAGLREAEDAIEKIGIQRTIERAQAADLRIYLVDDGEVGVDPIDPEDIVVRAKADLSMNGSGVSGLTGVGVSGLLDQVGEVLEQRVSSSGLFSRERHRSQLRMALHQVDFVFGKVADIGVHPDLLAEELRLAVRSLEAIVGRVDVEVVLGEIFSSFCIGK